MSNMPRIAACDMGLGWLLKLPAAENPVLRLSAVSK
jgi:hypothetical protein